MQVLNKQNVINLLRTTCSDNCLPECTKHCTPPARAPTASWASTTPENSMMWSKGWGLLGWKSSGVCKRKKRENRRLVSYFCKGGKKKPPLFPRGEVIPPRGPVKKAARCNGLSLASSKAATQSFAHPSCSGPGERIKSVKARKLVG